jgi:hypothetical protein
MTRARTTQLASLGLALTMAGARTVRAAEGEGLAAVSAGFATARADGRWAPGAGGCVAVQYGLDDSWSAGARLSGSWHPVDGAAGRPDGLVRSLGGSAGVTYALDVLRVVPFLSAELAVQNLGGAVRDARTDLGVELGGGADYLLDRRWSVGVDLAYRVLPLPLAGERGSFGGTPQTFAATLRLARRW